MKKYMSAFVICGALFVGACDGSNKAQEGDTVIIDFAGYMDGTQFEGGTGNWFSAKIR